MKHLIIAIGTGLALTIAALTQAKQQNDSNNATTAVHRGARGGSQVVAATGPRHRGMWHGPS